MIIAMNYLEITKAAHSNQTVSFSSEMDIFNHHFPSSPILPGALSAQLLAESCGGRNWSLKKINGLRFRKPLTPDLPVTISCEKIRETESEKVCAGKIQSGSSVIADGEFVFSADFLPLLSGGRPDLDLKVWNAAQIRNYLPHGEVIVLIDQLVESVYPKEIQDYLDGKSQIELDQSKLVGTKIHTRSILKPENFWLNQKVFPSTVLSELVAQAGALTLAPFFTGTKPQVSLLGCDTEYFAQAEVGSTIDTFLELTRAKRLGKMANMIIFKSECYIGQKKIADVSLNAMAQF
jgi:3-hydroxymyristoyl/3-hydroxydecanoyl-(acyl carrier protein) dehydratase